MTILFPSEDAANALVAGLPCAARVVHRLQATGALSASDSCVLAVPSGWKPSALTWAECRRLAPDAEVAFGALDKSKCDIALDAIGLLDPKREIEPADIADIISGIHFRSEEYTRKALAKAGREIVASTGKPTDGIVSRAFNRPFSQACSRLVLNFAWIRPIHATIAAASIGLAMALCLFLGGEVGLVAGAVLFQLASMIDGCDGEIARATHRSSQFGATLDTASDALTNFAFIAGVAFNLWQQGDRLGAQAGFAGLACLLVGLTILGLKSLAAGGPLSFDALKHEASARRSPVVQFIGKIASRDVYALVLALLIVLGLATAAMIGFAAATSLWLAVVLLSLVAKR